MKSCSNCKRLISEERLKALPNTEFCIDCAKTLVKPKRGAMNYSHKTAPTLMVMDNEFFHNEWKHYNPTFGRGSGVHKLSRATSNI